MKQFKIVCALALTTALAFTLTIHGQQAADAGPSTQQASQPSEAALERTRRTVRMLDDIYKQTVVLITDKYVHTEDDFPAGSAAVALFKAISDKGWHKVRLIDATGAPYESKNVAQDDFEKRGIEELQKGKGYYEQIVEEDGEHHLRAITPVPVVMDKCIMCHEQYADVEKGQPIGAISYSILID